MSDNRFIKFRAIADVKQGLATGDNRYYLRQLDTVRGTYQRLNRTDLLTDEEIKGLTVDEKTNGVDPARYEGRRFVPYDKGGEGDARGGWLPNYFVPTGYFIDWSRNSVKRLKTQTSERQAGRLAGRFQNSEYYFRPGLTWSDAGFYSPTIRFSGLGVFDVKGSRIIVNGLSNEATCGLLCSRLAKLIIKCINNHTVSTQVDDFREPPVPVTELEGSQIAVLVREIVENQKRDQQYQYHLYEQKEIDEIVYDLYRLTPDVIRDVEIWYCRRYESLSRAQGFYGEIFEKYSDHLARCARILSKPPEYWQSNPVLKLIASGESSQIEFKETLEANNKTGESLPGLLVSALKTVAAFLNTSGGTLLIGVSDSGEIKGLDLDKALCKQPTLDSFELKLHDLMKDRLKAPIGSYSITFEHLPDGDVCRIDVEPNPGVVFLDGKDVYVRVGNRSEKLEGPRLAEWIQSRNAQ